MTRRFFLQGLLMAIWSRVYAAGGQVADRFALESPMLSPVAMETLLAFGEVLVVGRALSPAERGYLAEHIEGQARRVRFQLDHYRMAARLLDRLAGRPFSTLTLVERSRLVERYRLDAHALPTSADPAAYRSEARLVRAIVVPDLIAGYWRSPAGWEAVGYTTFPGRCGDLRRYTLPEP